jgi:hypothetical protein
MHAPTQSKCDARPSKSAAFNDPAARGEVVPRHQNRNNVVRFPDEIEHSLPPSPGLPQAPIGYEALHACKTLDMDGFSYAAVRRRAEAERAAHLSALVRRIPALLRPLLRTASYARPLQQVRAPISFFQKAAWQRPDILVFALMTGILAVLIAAKSLGLATPAECRADPAALAIGSDIDATMTVTSGTACSLWAKAATTSFEEIAITSPPQHGIVTLRGRIGVIYRPDRKFEGEDFFAFALRDMSALRNGSSLVRVRVTVR